MVLSKEAEASLLTYHLTMLLTELSSQALERSMVLAGTGIPLILMVLSKEAEFKPAIIV